MIWMQDMNIFLFEFLVFKYIDYSSSSKYYCWKKYQVKLCLWCKSVLEILSSKLSSWKAINNPKTFQRMSFDHFFVFFFLNLTWINISNKIQKTPKYFRHVLMTCGSWWTHFKTRTANIYLCRHIYLKSKHVINILKMKRRSLVRLNHSKH